MSTASATVSAITETCSVLLAPGDVHEMRILETRHRTVSGYFNDHAQLAQAAAGWDGKAPGIYITINPCRRELLSRAVNRLQEYAKHTTSDSDILRRRWLSIDCDPLRPAGIGSTDAEHTVALQRAEEIRTFLVELGFPRDALILADSGNGGHVLVRIDLPNEPKVTDLICRCLTALALFFDDEAVKVDQTTGNAARIWKLYGTLAAKGDSTSERPHRRARLLDFAPDSVVVDRQLLNTLASHAPRVDTKTRHTGPSFHLSKWLADHSLPVVATGPWQNGGQRWVLNPCPWNPEHNNRAAFIVQFPSGPIAAGCHHDGCHGRGWADLRALFEPSQHPVSAPTPPTDLGRASLDDVRKAFNTHLHLTDTGLIVVIVGAVAAGMMRGDPVWLLIVGPPGSGKTEHLASVYHLPGVHHAATMTAASLLSGTSQRERSSDAKGGLLRQIGKQGILVLKNFTSILSMPRDPRQETLSALREVYDGRWDRPVGADGGRVLHWEGKLTIVAGVTEAIDVHHAVMGALGERFLLFRMPSAKQPSQLAIRALQNVGHEEGIRKQLADAVTGLFAGITLPQDPPERSQAELLALTNLADLSSWCRSAVVRDGYKQEIILVPDREAPTRVAKALAGIYGGMLVLGTERAEAWRLVLKIALDCLPKLRRAALQLLAPRLDWLKTNDIAEQLRHPTQTVRRTLEDMQAFDIVNRQAGGEGKADLWHLSDRARDLFAKVQTVPEKSEEGQSATTQLSEAQKARQVERLAAFKFAKSAAVQGENTAPESTIDPSTPKSAGGNHAE